jgi:hypothetical protein
MPYAYEVSFDITPEQMTELEIGRSLERIVGYLKTRLPAERGFVYAHCVYSVDDPSSTRVVMRSEWSDWPDVVRHRESSLLEDKVFEEFGPHVTAGSVAVRTYAEVGSGPFSARR